MTFFRHLPWKTHWQILCFFSDMYLSEKKNRMRLRLSDMYLSEFKVEAKYGNKKCEPSLSNHVRTEDESSRVPMIDFPSVNTATVDMRGAIMTKQARKINASKGIEFGKVRNVKHVVKSEGDMDILELTWNPPSFGNYEEAYKVEEYLIDVQKRYSAPMSIRSRFEYGRTEYSYEAQLELGQKYDVSVRTSYEDIDEDIIRSSCNHTFSVYSSNFSWHLSTLSALFKLSLNLIGPCKPEIIKNDILEREKKIALEWKNVDARKEDELIKYKVCLKTLEKHTEREFIFQTENVTLDNLVAARSYFVTISAGNSDGYGPASTAVNFTIPDLGEPVDVVLENVASTTASLRMKFEEAFGNPLYYEAELIQYQDTAHFVKSPRERLFGDFCHVYNDLDTNSMYMAKVYAIYVEGAGKPACSGKAWTAPAKSKLDTCCCSKNDNGGYEIAVKWHGDRHCDWFEVEVRYGEESKLESKLSIERKTEITHHCIHAALQYSVKVRAKNNSGLFGDWSDERIVFPDVNVDKLAENSRSDNSDDCSEVEKTAIIMDPCNKHLPHLPGTEIRICPIIDFGLVKKKVLKPKSCKLSPPYLIIKEPIEIEILSLEDEWRYYGTTNLTTKQSSAMHAFQNEVLCINKNLKDLHEIRFSIRMKIFIDSDYNFACLTCLDYEPVLQEAEKHISNAKSYLASPRVIKPIWLEVGDSLTFTLLNQESKTQIFSWSVHLNEKFMVHGKWYDIQNLAADSHLDKDRKLTKLSLKIVEKFSGGSQTLDVNVSFQPRVKETSMPVFQTVSANTFAQAGATITQTNNDSTKGVWSSQSTGCKRE